MRHLVLLLACLFAIPAAAQDRIGERPLRSGWSVSKMLNSDKVIVTAFDDPKVSGVSCHISQVQIGGIAGAFGLAEDPTHVSIACRQTGAIDPAAVARIDKSPEGEIVFTDKLSPLFKELRVVRLYDQKRHVLVYLIYSTKILEGSYKNSISTVPLAAS